MTKLEGNLTPNVRFNAKGDNSLLVFRWGSQVVSGAMPTNPLVTAGVCDEVGYSNAVRSRYLLEIVVLGADPRPRRTWASVRRRSDCRLIILRPNSPKSVTQVATDIVLVAGWAGMPR